MRIKGYFLLRQTHLTYQNQKYPGKIIKMFKFLILQLPHQNRAKKKLSFTIQALSQINKIAIGDDKKFFRITVQGGGCSGLKYNFGFLVNETGFTACF